MSTTYEAENSSESQVPVVLQEPAMYLYGDELKKLQASNAERLDYEGTPHSPWIKGELFTEVLAEVEKRRDELIVLGASDEEVEAKVAEEHADVISRMMPDLTFLYGEEAPEKFSTIAEIESFVTERRTYFMEEAQSRERELEGFVEEFTLLVELAIEHSGLPITRQQLHQRLKGLRIGFNDSLNGIEDGAGGYYSSVDHSVSIALLTTDARKELRRKVFHELFHAVSGQRMVKNDGGHFGLKLRRIGLETDAHDRKTHLNEAITDSLANIFASDSGPLLTSFGDTIHPLTLPIVYEEEDLYEVYNSQITVASLVLEKIPAYTLLRAYFAEDNDPFEEDPRAGVHTERELWRAVKVASGAQRIKELRVLEHGFEDDDTKQCSLAAAQKMNRKDARASSRRRRRNERAVLQNAKKREEMIVRAKSHAAERE